MNLEILRRRAVRILTRPPELLYAFTRHWILLLFCVAAGVGTSWGLVVSQPFLYEGRMQLLVNPSDPMLSTLSQSAAFPSPRTRFENRRFLANQRSILHSDAVVGGLLRLCGKQGVKILPDSARSSSQLGGIDERIASVKAKVSELLRIQQPELPEAEPGEITETMIGRIRDRSNVVLGSEGSSIDLFVYGQHREAIRTELFCWFSAYKNHLLSMAETNWVEFLEDQSKATRQLKKEAWNALESYRKEHRDVTDDNLVDYGQRIAQLQIERYDLQRRIRLGDFASPSTFTNTDPEVRRLQKQRRDLQFELVRAQAGGATPRSTTARKISTQIEWIDEQLKGHDLPAGASEEEREAALKKKLELVTQELQDLWIKRDGLNEEFKDYHDLRTRYARAGASFEKFETMKQETRGLLSSERILNVMISDGPVVGREPYNHHPFQSLGIGALAGVGLALVLAVILELLCGKVRFKHDLVGDFDLPIIAVIPK